MANPSAGVLGQLKERMNKLKTECEDYRQKYEDVCSELKKKEEKWNEVRLKDPKIYLYKMPLKFNS